MAKYLITGGCGFIGSHLVEGLVALGHHVKVLDDLSSGKKNFLPREVELIQGNILEQELVFKALSQVDGCFHLAAISSVEKSIHQWRATTEVNLLGIIHLFEAIAKLDNPIPVIYASSAAVYAGNKTFPLNESDLLSPTTPYGVDKIGNEYHAKMAWNLFQIPSIGFRFFNVYGPRQDPSSPYSGVIALFTKQILSGKPVTIFGDGGQVRDFIYVGDIVRYLLVALENSISNAQVFNLCTGQGHTIEKLADLIGKITGKHVKKEFAPPREGDPKMSIGDPMKAINTFGIKADVNLKEGLELLLASLKVNHKTLKN